ncbi:hypothetical protein Hokovirus_2_42 [Hokovirus HKV1]|uniref:Uncharacterized protein n=1 Tax=Hokovirus HKV1 TaxID=1977638 RepID=A0A1V0SFL9_9VIRU|nr:hypothetical protein Hokovirus_2_42 [Hokovirus HKV1]
MTKYSFIINKKRLEFIENTSLENCIRAYRSKFHNYIWFKNESPDIANCLSSILTTHEYITDDSDILEKTLELMKNLKLDVIKINMTDGNKSDFFNSCKRYIYLYQQNNEYKCGFLYVNNKNYYMITDLEQEYIYFREIRTMSFIIPKLDPDFIELYANCITRNEYREFDIHIIQLDEQKAFILYNIIKASKKLSDIQNIIKYLSMANNIEILFSIGHSKILSKYQNILKKYLIDITSNYLRSIKSVIDSDMFLDIYFNKIITLADYKHIPGGYYRCNGDTNDYLDYYFYYMHETYDSKRLFYFNKFEKILTCNICCNNITVQLEKLFTNFLNDVCKKYNYSNIEPRFHKVNANNNNYKTIKFYNERKIYFPKYYLTDINHNEVNHKENVNTFILKNWKYTFAKYIQNISILQKYNT